MTLKIVKQNVGIDLSKDDFKANFSQIKNGKIHKVGSSVFNNTALGMKSFLKWANKKSAVNIEVRFTMEATGVYYENLAHFLHENGCYVSIVVPRVSAYYIKSLGIKTKNDKVDAKALAQMGLERDLGLWEPGCKLMKELRQLTRERDAAMKDKTSNTNRLHALKHSHLPNELSMVRLEERIQVAKDQIKEIDREITQIFKKDEVLAQKEKNITKIRGIGLTTLSIIVAETNGFYLFSSREQLTSYAGYDVVENQSGKYSGKTKISKAGCPRIRKALHFAALTAVQHEPVFKDLYDRVFERTKVKMKAYVAVQRKLLTIIYSLYKNDVMFDPNHRQKVAERQNESKDNLENQASKLQEPVADLENQASELQEPVANQPAFEKVDQVKNGLNAVKTDINDIKEKQAPL